MFLKKITFSSAVFVSVIYWGEAPFRIRTPLRVAQIRNGGGCFGF